jgi:hypothetical protein
MATFKQIGEEKATRANPATTLSTDLDEDDFAANLFARQGAIPADVDLEPENPAEPDPVPATLTIAPIITAAITAEATGPEPEPEPVRLSPREIADLMADAAPEPVPGRFIVGEEIPVAIAGHGTADVQQPVPDDPKEIRNLLIDLMEQYPDIVNDLLATAKEMEASEEPVPAINPTITNVSGATVDR